MLASLAGGTVTPLAAQQLAPVLDHYQLDVWRAQDGVRLAFTSNLVETRDGFLWMSSQSGLTRFDGLHFRVFTGANTPALRGRPNLQTYPLVEDGRGVLWIGSDVGPLAYERGTFFARRPDSTFATDLVNDAAVDPLGRVWAITRLGRLFRVGRAGNDKLPSNTVLRALGSRIAIDASGDVWIAAGAGGVYRVRHDSVSPVAFGAADGLREVNQIVPGTDGSLWMATPTGVVHWRDRVVQRITLPARVAPSAVSCFAIAPDGVLWIGTEGAGLYRYDGRTLAHLSRLDGLSDDRVIDIMLDGGRNVWVATRDGLNRLRPLPFAVLTTRAGLPSELVGGVLRDRDGVVWTAPPTGGLYHGRIVDGHASFVPARGVTRSDRVTALAIGPGGHVWAGRRDGTVLRFVGSADPRVVLTGLPPVTDLREDEDGTLWVGTWHGLIRWRRGAVRTFDAREGLPDDAVHRLLRDSRGTLWVATQGGIARAGPGDSVFTPVPVPGGGAQRATVLFEAPAGTLWAGSANGLARLSGGRVALITIGTGLPESWTGAGERDGGGNLWLGQLGGLARLRLDDLVAVADGRSPRLTSVISYPSPDGLPGGDPTAWPHPWSFRDSAGVLWFAFGHGLAMVDPAQAVATVRPPSLLLEDVLVDGTAIPVVPSVTIGAAAQRVEFRFTGVDLSDGAGVRYRYRMDGFDTAWTDAGTDRAASYTRLAAGRYRFHVGARSGSGNWAPGEARVDLDVLAPLYRRSWFVIAAALALALILWLVHRGRLRTRSLAVREERSRLAREIHDSLLQGFGGIALQLHVASSRLALPVAQQPQLDRVLRLIDSTLTQARQAVWDMRLPESTREDITVACATAADRILSGGETRVRLTQRGRTRRLSPDAWAACLRIVEEALVNVRKHAHAAEAVVDFVYTWRRLRITIRDDGCGDDLDLELGRPGHWGLLGMRERASRIGARLSIASRRGVGTVVTLDVGYANGILTWPEPADAQE